MTVYAPGTQERDPSKQNMALQDHAKKIATLQTPNYGLINSGGALGVSLSKITASLGSDVAISNSVYSDGPSIAQGTTGTWLASGTVTVTDTANVAQINAKLWDGTRVISSGATRVSAANGAATLTLSGFLASPSANIRISCTSNAVGATSTFKFNTTGNSKDCTLTAIRIA